MSGRRSHRRPARPAPRHVRLRIDLLGAQGDGVATLDGSAVYVPDALPGELVDAVIDGSRGAALTARPLAVLEAAPDRAQPACRHFGDCGGCTVQHLESQPYGAWKAALLASALARRGLAHVVPRPLLRIPPGTRRRAALAAVRRGDRVVIGFHARARHRVVDLAACPILLPVLFERLAPLRRALLAVLRDGGSADLLMVQTETGPDLLVTSPEPPDLAGREALAALADTEDFARISWSAPGGIAEPVIQRRLPVVRFAGIAVSPPPGPFLQPSLEGEAALTDSVVEATGDATIVADLFAGCGTFSLPLAVAGARVHAVDGAGPALAALSAAARGGGLGQRLATERRDLESRPLRVDELEGFAAVVFDPPRAGARAQAEMLAASRVPVVVAVSCNPATFARDARILVDGGYRLDWVQPVDQFPWTGHLELVARFARR